MYGPPPQHPYGGDPYGGGQPGWPPPYGPVADDDQATTALVLGILGLAVCGVIAPFAWSIGRASMKRIDASGGRLGGRGRAQAGYICGIVGTIELALFVIGVVLVFAVASTTTAPMG